MHRKVSKDADEEPLQRYSVDGSLSAEDSSAVRERRSQVMAACACILGNETAERLAYYGLQTNMSLYAKQFLGYGAARATSMLQAWKATVYLTPLLGAYIADAHLGRFNVILLFSSLYLAGMAGISAVNTAPSLRPRFNKPPESGSFGLTRSMFWAFMYLVALGSGGIKACVSSFGGDQFRDTSPREVRWRSSFFNWFYFAINAGSLVATLVVVPVQETKGYAIGFGIPTALMGAAILVLLAGAAAKLYTYVPPEGSPLKRIYRVLRDAARNRKQPLPPGPEELHDPAPGSEGAPLKFRMAHTERMRALDKAAIPHGLPGEHQVSVTEVEETKALVGIAPIFLCICIWQMCYDPIFSLLPLSGDAMDRHMGSGGAKVPASSVSFANTFGVMISVAAYDIFLVPICARAGRPITTMARIGAGYAVAIVALLSAGFIEVGRYRVVRSSGLIQKWEAAVASDPKVDYTDAQFTQPMSIWWQVIPYFVMGAAETLTNIGVMELFFNEVSEGTRSLGSSINLLTTAVGTYLAGALNMGIAAGTKSDPWVADNPMFGHYDLYYFVNAGILALGYLAFCWVARGYKEKPTAHHGDDGDKDIELVTGSDLATAEGLSPTAPRARTGAAAVTAAGELRSRWPRTGAAACPPSPPASSGYSGSPSFSSSRPPGRSALEAQLQERALDPL